MASVYDRTDIYDLFDSPKKDAQTLSHWQTVFDGRPIRSALDVSIGTGSLTLPLVQLGVSLCGSDLSDSMLARCRKKADERVGSRFRRNTSPSRRRRTSVASPSTCGRAISAT